MLAANRGCWSEQKYLIIYLFTCISTAIFNEIFVIITLPWLSFIMNKILLVAILVTNGFNMMLFPFWQFFCANFELSSLSCRQFLPTRCCRFQPNNLTGAVNLLNHGNPLTLTPLPDGI